MRKRCTRRPVTPLPPPGLRQKLSREQVRELAHLHYGNLDLMARSGMATPNILWELMASTLTWSRAAELSGLATEDMHAQIDLMTAVAQRYRDTGRIGFSGYQYQQAKAGAAVMDALAETVDLHIAKAAADWSEQRIAAITANEPPEHLPGYTPPASPKPQTATSSPCP